MGSLCSFVLYLWEALMSVCVYEMMIELVVVLESISVCSECNLVCSV